MQRTARQCEVDGRPAPYKISRLTLAVAHGRLIYSSEFALVFARFELYLIISARLLVNSHRSLVSSLPTRKCQTEMDGVRCFHLIPLSLSSGIPQWRRPVLHKEHE